MAVTFGYQYYIMKPNEISVVEGLIIPTCTDCNLDQWFKSISIIGSNVLCHYLKCIFNNYFYIFRCGMFNFLLKKF